MSTHTMYVISVAAGRGHYRHIRIRSTATLLELHQVIVDAYQLIKVSRPSFEVESRKEGRIKYSLNRTATTIALRDTRLEDTVFATKGYMIYSLADPELAFRCRTLRTEQDTDPETQVVAQSGGCFLDAWIPDILRLLGQISKTKGTGPEQTEDGIDLPVFDRLIDFLFAAINLYGIIPLDTLYAYYRQHWQNVPQPLFVWIALLCSGKENSYICVVDAQGRKLGPDDDGDTAAYLVDGLLLQHDMFEDIHARQRGKDYYLPNPEEFMRYATPNYVEHTPAYLQFRQQLVTHGLSSAAAEKITFQLSMDCRYGNFSVHTLFDDLKRARLHKLCSSPSQSFLDLCAAFNNTTRTYSNCGHTPDELIPKQARRKPTMLHSPDLDDEKILPFPTVSQKPKPPGRNAPCPCGSGKKYKHCCGKS